MSNTAPEPAHDRRCLSLTDSEFNDVCDCRTLRMFDEHWRVSKLVAAALALPTKTAADFDAQMAQVKTLSQAADAETKLVKAGASVRDQLLPVPESAEDTP